MNNYDEIERKISLIKNYLEDNLSVAEEEELRVWLDESPKHRETFQRIRDKKILFAKLEYRQRQETETDWKVICRKTGIGSSRRLWYIRVARYAAVFFGLCLGYGCISGLRCHSLRNRHWPLFLWIPFVRDINKLISS